MINKKTLVVTAFALLLSQQSVANETEGFYFGGGYHGQFFNNTSELKVKITGSDATAENNVSINDREAKQTKGQLIGEYKPNYNPPFAANMKFGYAGKFKNHSYRAELEGVYSLVKVDNIGLANTQMTIGYVNGKDKKDNYGAIVNNDQIENASVMANVYHHWKNRFSFSPYVGAGVGVTRMKMFEKPSIGPACQLKAGLDYRMTEDTNVHIGYRYFGAIGTNFKLTAKKLGTTNNGTFTAHSGSEVTEEINIGNKLFSAHGVEVGLTVHFASKA